MQPIVVIIGMIVLIVAGIAVTILGSKPKKKGASSKNDLLYLKLYKRFYQFPLTGDKIRKITAQIQSMSVYTKRQTYIRACKYFLTSSGVMFAVVIASIFLFRDMISILICIAFAVVFSNVLIDKKVDKINHVVYKELRATVSSLRQEYMRLGSVVEALQECEIGPELRTSFDEILNIMTTSNGELKLQEFFQKTPFRPVQTLARVCYNVNNVGDEKDAYGQSNFVQALTLMSTDINSELERILYQKKKFGIIEYLPLVPIPCMKLIETYFTGIMPGTALIYQGVLGYIIRVVILLSAILCYNVISTINNIQSIRDDDRTDWSMKLLESNGFAHFIVGLAPKNAKRRRLQRTLKNCLSRKTIEQLYTEKLVFGIVGFVIAILTFASTAQMGKQYMLNSVQQLSLVATDEMSEYDKAKILEMDTIFMGMCEQRGEIISDQEATELVGGAMGGLTDLQKQDQVKRMKDKYKSIKSAYFHWYFVPISFLIAISAWYGPNIMLNVRKFLVKTEAEEDFLQLQTLMTIIMNSDCDTLEAIEQLTDISKIHKDSLLYCYHSFPSNPELELARLEAKTPILEFKRFVGKLKLTVNDLSLREAFSDLIIEREHVVKLREMAMYESIDKKRTLCGILSLTPLGLTVVGELLVPIGYLGAMEFMNALASMNA